MDGALRREDALAYYRRFYSPGNAILVVEADDDPDQTLRTGTRRAAGTGPAPRAADDRRTSGDSAQREGAAAELAAPLSRPVLPHCSSRRVGSAEVLGRLIGGGQTSLLYREDVL